MTASVNLDAQTFKLGDDQPIFAAIRERFPLKSAPLLHQQLKEVLKAKPYTVIDPDSFASELTMTVGIDDRAQCTSDSEYSVEIGGSS